MHSSEFSTAVLTWPSVGSNSKRYMKSLKEQSGEAPGRSGTVGKEPAGTSAGSWTRRVKGFRSVGVGVSVLEGQKQ